MREDEIGGKLENLKETGGGDGNRRWLWVVEVLGVVMEVVMAVLDGEILKEEEDGMVMG